jgi:hypothetical protein
MGAYIFTARYGILLNLKSTQIILPSKSVSYFVKIMLGLKLIIETPDERLEPKLQTPQQHCNLFWIFEVRVLFST